jgi:hypothetical protein
MLGDNRTLGVPERLGAGIILVIAPFAGGDIRSRPPDRLASAGARGDGAGH